MFQLYPGHNSNHQSIYFSFAERKFSASQNLVKELTKQLRTVEDEEATHESVDKKQTAESMQNKLPVSDNQLLELQLEKSALCNQVTSDEK